MNCRNSYSNNTHYPREPCQLERPNGQSGAQQWSSRFDVLGQLASDGPASSTTQQPNEHGFYEKQFIESKRQRGCIDERFTKPVDSSWSFSEWSCWCSTASTSHAATAATTASNTSRKSTFFITNDPTIGVNKSVTFKSTFSVVERLV